MKKLFVVVFVFVASISWAATGEVEIVEIRPTPFFPKVIQDESLKQIAQIFVMYTGHEMPVQVRVNVEDYGSYSEDIDTLEMGQNTLDVHVLDIQKPRTVRFELLDNNKKVLAEKVMTWQPQKKWKVYYAAVSHHDLGFITYYQNIRRAVREEGIELALEYCRKTDSWDDNDQFRWNIETSEPLIRWISKQPPEKIKEFEQRVQEGRIGISANHNTISSQMAGYEVLARSFYTPNRYVIDKLDIQPSDIALINDVTGITRSWPLYLKEAEISYFMHGSNYPNCLNDMYDIPVFYWKSPDGDPENVPLCRTDSYYSPNKVSTWDVEGVSDLIHRHVEMDWAYDCILAYDSHDFSIPTLENAENIKLWNTKYEYPKFRCSLISSYFEDIGQQIIPGEVVETSKDAPDSWNDQEIIDADLLAKARRVNFEIPTTEKLASIAMALSGGYPEKDLFQAYNRVVMYHEHTNGAIDGGNPRYYETENIMHQSLVDEAIEFNQNALEISLEKIGERIKTKTSSLVVFNSLNWERDEMVYFESAEVPFEYFKITDPDSKKVLDVQKLTDGRLAFFAEDIPSMGFKTYTIKKANKPSFIASSQSTGTDLENDFYRLKIDRNKNIIADLVDKQLGKNIIDKSSPYALGEYIHYDHYSREWKKTEFTNIEYYKGILLDEIHISQDAYLTGKVELVVYVHHKTKKIDFALEVDKLSNGEELIAGWNRYLKEASFCALPVNVPNYQHHHELAGAVTQPGNKELQFEASESSFYAIQHFADASNEDFGVTLSTIETNLVEYGHPRPVYWDNGGSRPKEEIVKPENSNMFLFLMNNFFQTNVKVDQPGLKKFTFSINSHGGDWKTGKAYKFAWETSHPIIPQYLERNKQGVLDSKRSFLKVDKDNVVCSTLKKAEANGDGFILRFFELEGKNSKVKMKLDLNRSIRNAYAVTLIENNLEELTVIDNNEIEFEINGHGIKTIRVLSNPAGDPAVKALKAVAVSNAEVNLNWSCESSNKVSHFNIYRSLDQECEANALNFIGTSEGTTYLDKTELNYGGWAHNRLDPNTTYYYRVVPVDKFNNKGNVSNTIKCATLRTEDADAKPAKVQGVYTVHVSPLAPENYINVWFYTNFDKDVDKYLIYRGETESFTPNETNLLHTLIPSKDSITFNAINFSNSELNRQMYADKTANVNIAYYYKVCAVDENGNKGQYADPAYAFMEMTPVVISSKIVASDSFEKYNPKAIVSIDCAEPGYDIYYTAEGSSGKEAAKKYTGEFEIGESKIIDVVLNRSGEKEPAYRYRRLVVVSQALCQSEYGTSYSAVMAIDGSINGQWVSKQYGGQTRENPADVWLGVNLGTETKFNGLKIIGDKRDMMPVQKDFRIFIRKNADVIEVKDFKLEADANVKNTYAMRFNEEQVADGIMIYIDKEDLPKSELPEQDGLVRICELKLLGEEGEIFLN